MRLALELWDRNIHLTWMRSKGYLLHNGTKDLEFCRLMADPKTLIQGIQRHQKQSEEQKDIDSAHHSISYSEFENVLINKQEVGLIYEVFYDQASITGRWYKKALRLEEPHSKVQEELKSAGPLFSRKFWRYNPNRYSQLPTTRQEQIKQVWLQWCKANDDFTQFWTDLFEEDNSQWNPPADFEGMINLAKQ